MDMKLWNFLERANGIENMIVYVENRTAESYTDESIYSAQINVEDTDSETIEATFKISENTEEAREEKIKFITGLFGEFEEVVDLS